MKVKNRNFELQVKHTNKCNDWILFQTINNHVFIYLYIDRLKTVFLKKNQMKCKKKINEKQMKALKDVKKLNEQC